MKPASSPAERPIRLPVALAVVEYRKPSVELTSKVQVEQIQTPFIRQARISLVQMWGGRVRLDGFGSATSMKDVLDGPVNSVRAGTIQARTKAEYGFSLSLRLGRDPSL